MSLFLYYASAIIDITAKVAFLLFAVSRSTDVASTWFLVTAQITETDPGCNRPTDPNKALGGSLDYRY